MYADGDGVAQDDLRAFEYFSRIANQHAEDNPSAPQAAIVANAFVALGRYYLNGIPNSKIKSDPERAREMFSYAASYFGNADAQYDLARLYLKSSGASRDDFRYGTRWLGLAAQKGQHQAQALLGQMLFNGDQMPPQRARGLMWLTLARDSAAPDETWIKESYNKAIAKASRKRPGHGAADARALGAGPQGLKSGAGRRRALRRLRCYRAAHGRLQIEIDPDRHVVRRLLPGPHIAVDPDIDQPVAGLRRQQQVVDADAVVLLPGAGLIVPEGVLAGRIGDRAQRVGQPEAEQRLKALRGSPGGTARRWPRRPDCGRRAAAGMTLKSPASTSGSSVLSRSFEYSRSRDIHLSL